MKIETIEEVAIRIENIQREEWQAERSYSEEDMRKAQQAILGNIKDAMHDENYIIDYLKNK